MDRRQYTVLFGEGDQYITEVLGIREVEVIVSGNGCTVRGAGPLCTTLSIWLEKEIAGDIDRLENEAWTLVTKRLLRATELCSICGEEAPPEVSAARLRPWVCDSELCSFQRDKFGAGTDPVQELRNNPETTQLLVHLGALCDNAEISKNCRVLHELLGEVPHPYRGPPPTGRNKLWLRKVLGACQTYLRYGRDPLPRDRPSLLNRADPDVFDVVDFNARHLAEFRKGAGTHGVVRAYHGSPSTKWIYILNGGLRNMSGTTGQLNGAAYGAGIYLAENLEVSYGYALGRGTRSHSTKGQAPIGGLVVVAECEVVKVPEYCRKWPGGGSIWVVPVNEHVRVIRLLVWKAHQS